MSTKLTKIERQLYTEYLQLMEEHKIKPRTEVQWATLHRSVQEKREEMNGGKPKRKKAKVS